MKKLVLSLALAVTALTLAACGNSSQGGTSSTSKQHSTKLTSNSSSQSATTGTLNAAHLTPAQTAALVLYYGDAHMPGADSNDYSSHMARSGQGAVVKIYDKDAVPKKVGLLYKTYPAGASLLYSMQLTNPTNNGHLDSIYYTISGDQFYFFDGDAGLTHEGVTTSQMVAYAQKHGGVSRILNVAKNTKVQDLRGQSTASNQANASGGLTTQQLGTLVALYAQPDWFKAGVKSDAMYYGTDKSGYSFVTANGDPTSWVYFKQNGNDVTIKYVHPEGDETVAETPQTVKHLTVDRLKADYYTNQSQKNEVNGYADKLKPESEYNDD